MWKVCTDPLGVTPMPKMGVENGYEKVSQETDATEARLKRTGNARLVGEGCVQHDGVKKNVDSNSRRVDFALGR